MKKIIIDTNGILRLLLDDIPTQADKIEKLFKQAKAGSIQIFIPQIVVFELQFALEKFYHFKKQTVIQKIKSLISTQYLQVESHNVFASALTLYEDTKASFVDCFLVSQAKIQEMTLVTFDKKLKEMV